MVHRLIMLVAAVAAAACDFRADSLAQQGPSGSAAAAAAPLRMPVPRAAHGAVTLPDRRVLLIGGCVAESCEAGADSATVDAFDPRTGRFSRAGRLLDRRVSAATILLPSGEILIAGGWSGSSVTSLVEIFDPASGKSRRVGSLAVARSDIAAAALPDGRILLAGGYDGSRPVGLVEAFDPATSRVTRIGELLTPRTGAGGAVLRDGKLLLAGGGTEGLQVTASAEIFDPATGRSRASGNLSEARYKHAVVGLQDGTVLAIGGSDNRDSRGKLRSVERFDPASGAFSPAGTLAEARYKIGSSVVRLPNGRVLIAGGGERAELYDPVSGRSQAVGPEFGKRLNFATASLLPDGSVLVAGGYDENGIRMSADAWIVRPAQR